MTDANAPCGLFFVPREASAIAAEQRELSGGTVANVAMLTPPVARWCPGFSWSSL